MKSEKEKVFVAKIALRELPLDWVHQIQETCVKVVVSPLHCFELVNGTSTICEPHYHFMIFDLPGTVAVSRLLAMLNLWNFDVATSPRAFARHMCHLDNPDLVKYRVEDVLCFNGANYTSLIKEEN